MDPLLEVKSKTLGTGIQDTLKAYPEEVKVRTVHSPRNVEVQTARYDDISKVEGRNRSRDNLCRPEDKDTRSPTWRDLAS